MYYAKLLTNTFFSLHVFFWFMKIISASYCQLTIFCTFCFLLFSYLYEANLYVIFCNKLHLLEVVVTLLCFCQKRPTRRFFCSLRKQKATHLDVTIPPPQHHTCLEERFGSTSIPTKHGRTADALRYVLPPIKNW